MIRKEPFTSLSPKAASSPRTTLPIPKSLILLSLGSLAACSSAPQYNQRYADLSVSGIDSKYGVRASPRVVADGDEVPKGGGNYMVGKPYKIAGKTYVPSEKPFAAHGTASWYGADFHGRRTANGEIFDRNSISAAHPTMPLPSYARVTNLRNSRSMVVRVNDRGPYHGGRVMDVSQRVAEALDFRSAGTAQVKVEWLGRANLAGDNDQKLLATLRDDGAPASLDGLGAAPVMTAEAEPISDPAPTRTASLVPKPPARPKKIDAPARHRDDTPRLRDMDMTAYAEESAVHVEPAAAAVAAHAEAATSSIVVTRAERLEPKAASARLADLDDGKPAPLPPARPDDLGADEPR